MSRHNSLSSSGLGYAETRHNSLVTKPGKKINVEGSVLHVKVENAAAAAAALALGDRAVHVPKVILPFSCIPRNLKIRSQKHLC